MEGMQLGMAGAVIENKGIDKEAVVVERTDLGYL